MTADRRHARELSAFLADDTTHDLVERLESLWPAGLSDPTLSYRDGQALSDTASCEVPTPFEAPSIDWPGYTVLEKVGAGGMGLVYRAREERLHREVAIKVIRPEKSSPETRAQFAAEARVSAILDHPNILPIYAFRDEPEALMIAMKLIGGASWKDALRQDRDAGSFDLDRHLNILMAVCDAIAYAHAKGIAHLDLKPGNVMVGAFNEVLVMDWGLAVAIRDDLGEDLALPATAIDRPRGTPCFMAPELALGLGDAIGPWTDTYVLGAILYLLLEGRPPHLGRNLLAALESAASSEPPPFEKAPEDLRAICRRALAPLPEERYAGAEDLRKALEENRRHRQSRAVSSRARLTLDRCLRSLEPESSQAGLERDQLYADLAGAIAGFQQAAHLWEENPEARAGEDLARHSLARAALEGGDLGLAESQGQAMVKSPEREVFLDDLAREKRRQERARRSARLTRRAFFAALATIVLGLAFGLIAAGRSNRALRSEQARSAARAAISQRALKALIEQVEVELADVAQARVRRARRRLLDTALTELRRLKETEPEDSPPLREAGSARLAIGALQMSLGRPSLAGQSFREAVALFRQIEEGAEGRALDLAQALFELARAHEASGRSDEARAALEEGLGLLRPDPSPPARRASAGALLRLAHLQQRAGRLPEARRGVEAGLSIARGLDQEPAARRLLADGLQSLGHLERLQGRLEAAAEAYQESLAIRRALSAADPEARGATRDLASACLAAAEVLARLAELGRAQELCDEAVKSLRILSLRDPEDAELQGQLLGALGQAGEIRKMRGDFAEALTLTEECVAAARRCAVLDPNSVSARRDLARALSLLGEARNTMGQTAEALPHLKEAIAILRALVAGSKDALDRQGLATSLRNWAEAQRRLKAPEAASIALKESAELLQALRSEAPSDVALSREAALTLVAQAVIARSRGDASGARDRFSEALVLYRELVDRERPALQDRHGLARCLLELATSESGEAAERLSEEALERQRALVKAAPDSSAAKSGLFSALMQRGDRLRERDPSAALATYDEALTLAATLAERSRDVDTRNELAAALTRIGGLKRAAGDLRGALATFESGLAISRDLAKRAPRDRLMRRNLSVDYLNIAGLQAALGDDKALATHKAALAIRRELLEEDPRDVDAIRDVVASLDAVAELSRAADPAAAEAAWLEAVRAIDRGLRDPVQRAEFGLSLLDKVVGSLEARGQTDEAIRRRGDGLARLRIVLEARPDQPGPRYRYQATLQAIANLHEQRGEEAAARARFREGIAGLEAALKRWPADLTFRRLLSIARYRLGANARRGGDFKAAAAAFDGAIDSHRLLVAAAPRFARELSQFIAERRNLELVTGERRPKSAADFLALANIAYDREAFVEAVEHFESALADPSLREDLTAGHRYNAACAAARAARASEDLEARTALRSRALSWLEEDLAARKRALVGLEDELEAASPAARGALEARRSALVQHRDYARHRDPDWAALRASEVFRELFEEP